MINNHITKFLYISTLLACCANFTLAGEIIKITTATGHLIPKGKSLDAIDGDWIMKNDKVILVIGNTIVGREVNMRVQSVQGAVIDFTSLEDNNDYLAAFYPHGFPKPDSRRNPAILTHTIELVKDKGNEIVLRAIRNVSTAVPYESVTEYTLRDGENFVRVKTTYTNKSEKEVSFILGDKLRMDMDIEQEASPLGKPKLAFMYNKWFGAAYGIYNPEGLLITEKPKLASDPAAGLLVGFQSQKVGEAYLVTLGPAEKIEATRYLIYGRDVAEIQREVMRIEKSNMSVTTLKVADKRKQSIEGVFIEVYDKVDSLVSFAITNAAGEAKIPLIPGEYRYLAFKVGHDSTVAIFSARKTASNIPVIMNNLTSVEITIKEEGVSGVIPIKVKFKGIAGYADPFLGTNKTAEGADNLYYSITSNFVVPISPGAYLVTFSRGPEYVSVERELTIKMGEKKALNAELKRAFTTPKWVLADLHNHSSSSGDNDTETRSRLINLVGSGIEFAPATEHNRISSYTGEIKELGLEKRIASAAGMEFTGPTGVPGGPNHQNAFPLTIQPNKQGGGAPPISGDVYTQMKGLNDYDKDKIKFVQHNHPGLGIAMLYFDGNRDGVLDDGIGTREFTDAIELQNHVYEILNVTSVEGVNKREPVFYWLQMLNQGYKIFGTMTSDNHIVGERGGLRFVYVYTENDDPASIDPYEMALNAKKGRMVMSNGPFLKVDIDGHLPGDEFVTEATPPIINIETLANNEIEIDRVQILVNGRQKEALNFTKETHPNLFNTKGFQFKHTSPLPLTEDSHVIVVATGKRRPDSQQLTKEELRPMPFAVTNPIFIDTNGDGFKANKDTLGAPLPVAKK